MSEGNPWDGMLSSSSSSSSSVPSEFSWSSTLNTRFFADKEAFWAFPFVRSHGPDAPTLTECFGQRCHRTIYVTAAWA